MHISLPRPLVAFLWLCLFAAPLALLPATDPGLIKWPLMAISASLAVFAFVRPKSVHWVDGLAGFSILYSLFHSSYYQDQWAVELASCIMGLFYILARWKQEELPSWVVLMFSWLVGFRGIWDFVDGSVWAMGKPFQMPSFFVNRNMFAYLLAPLIWYAWSQFRISSQRKWIWGMTFTFMLVVLISSQSRGALLGFLASIIAVGVVFARERRSLVPVGKALAGFLAVIISCFLLIHSMQGNLMELGHGVKFARTELPRNFHHKSSSETRRWIWQSTVDSWRENPVLGNGTGSAQYRMIAFQKPVLDDEANPFISAWHSHSHYLEILHDKGLLGIVLELSLLCIAFVGWGRGRMDHFYGVGALSALTVHNIVSEASEYPASIAVWWALIGYGIMLWSQRQAKRYEIRLVNLSVRTVLPILALIFSLLAVKPVLADLKTREALDARDPAVSVQLFGQAIDLWPDNPEALYALAFNLAQSRDYSRAVVVLDHLDSVAPGVKYTTLLRTQISYHKGDYDSVIKMAHVALENYPYQRELQDVFLASLMKSGKCEELIATRQVFRMQMTRLFLARNHADSISFAKQGNRLLRSQVELPIWVPASVYREFIKVKAPKIAAEKMDFNQRIAKLDAYRCP